MTASNAGGESEKSEILTVNTLIPFPTRPVDLFAVTIRDTYIDLTWTKVDGVTYNGYYKTTGDWISASD